MAPALRAPSRPDSSCPVVSGDPPAPVSPGPPFALQRRFLGSPDLQAAHHATKVVPAGEYDLSDMHQKEPNQAHRQPEMLPTRHLITSENRGQPVSLGWFIDRETSDQH